MKLMTKELEAKFLKAPLYSKDGKGEEVEVVVKYFNPYGTGTWLITEGNKLEDGDYEMFGLCHIHEWEWGYVMLSELESIKGAFGLGIERDMHTSGTVKELRRY